MSQLRSDVHASREFISLVLYGLEIVMCNYVTLVQGRIFGSGCVPKCTYITSDNRVSRLIQKNIYFYQLLLVKCLHL